VDRAQLQRHLGELLDEETRLLAELATLLESETDILAGDDPAAIQRIGGERHRCVDRLTQLDRERADLARMLSFGSGGSATQTLLAWADPSGALTAVWHESLQRARRCKDLNDKNGAIVAARLGRVRQLLARLRGSDPPSVYGPRSTRDPGLPTRDLGCA
jgi:flagellar biosynthesis/type III secretory pathway chaperone